MSRVLFLVNHDAVIYNFRFELVEELLKQNHEVFISCPYGERIDELVKIGAIHKDISIDRHGMNPLKDLKLIRKYKQLIREIKPDIVFSYTIKPNIYGAIAARKCGVPCVANITGLGTALENGGIKQKICLLLYRFAFKRVQKVFFQNVNNKQFFEKHKIALGKHDLLPGSGVNLERFRPLPYPNDSTIRFVFAGRIMREKGIDYYLESARFVKTIYPNTEFHVCGFIENEYRGKLQECIDSNLVVYHGMVRDIREVYRFTHCVVFPSYYPEGISNVLLEAAACARPIITTDRPGCKETVDNGITGFIVPVKNQRLLNEAIVAFIKLSEKNVFGEKGRKKIEKYFDRKIIIRKYLDELQSLSDLKG